jgi:enamine deaminase RidA (YjgF/YER057c/UK114 family)
VTKILRIFAGGAALLLVACVAAVLMQQRWADAQSPSFEVKYLNWGNWQARVGFSQAASAEGAARILFLSGVGSEAEMEGTVQHIGDFAAQCNVAWNSIRGILEREGGSMKNVVRIVTPTSPTLGPMPPTTHARRPCSAMDHIHRTRSECQPTRPTRHADRSTDRRQGPVGKSPVHRMVGFAQCQAGT